MHYISVVAVSLKKKARLLAFAFIMIVLLPFDIFRKPITQRYYISIQMLIMVTVYSGRSMMILAYVHYPYTKRVVIYFLVLEIFMKEVMIKVMDFPLIFPW